MNAGEVLTWREVIDKNRAALLDELTARLDSEIEATRAATESKERAQAASDVALTREQTARSTRLATTESLNQTLRRIRQAHSQAAALGILLDATAPYAAQAVVLRVENNQVRSLGVRGLAAGEDPHFEFELNTAPAIATVGENRDPIVALASAGELTQELASALSPGDPSRKAYLFPVIARQEVVAVLIAGGDPVPAALEMLSEAVGLKLEALEPEEPPALKTLPSSGLIQIAASAVSATPAAERKSWDDLSPEDQRLHLHAQRVARVKVAELRLYHADELKKGIFNGNIYSALKTDIDRARTEYLNTFLSKSPTMVDYLHLEILRSLAHEDERLLGDDYPGPMV